MDTEAEPAMVDVRRYLSLHPDVLRDEDVQRYLTLRPGCIREEDVRRYLNQHPESLESYIMEEVELEALERMMIRRTQRSRKPDNSSRKTSLSRWKFCVHADKRAMLQELTASLQEAPSESRVLEELSRCIASAVNADGHTLFLSTTEGLRVSQGGVQELESVTADTRRIVELVSSTRQPMRVSVEDGIVWSNPASQSQEETHHALLQPVSRSDGELLGVLCLCRRQHSGPFHEEDEEIVSSYLVWGGVAFHYAQLYVSVRKQRELQEFLLHVVRSIFQEMVNLDALIMKVIDFAQHLVEADRASLFLVDSKTKELYARLFDFGNEGALEHGLSKPVSRNFRFPLGTGIAGCVALSGQLLNIEDAYQDPRFNREVDQVTGYKTHSILSMPVFKSSGKVLGVVQMINKKTGTFTKEDEKNFEVFAVYCGLALNHAKLFEKVRRSEQKYKVALELLSYHSTCSEEEVERTLPLLPQQVPHIDNFFLNFLDLDDMVKVRQVIFMFRDLFGFNRLDVKSVIRFTLTVKKNYRKVPYHNWTHGFGVANSMYCILKQSPDFFTTSERLSLFIAALCHDLDHRGKNNKFMIESASPLANMYTTSTMEHHHFNQTVAILQQDGHNILQKLEQKDYRQVLGVIKHCILATDLMMFFENSAHLLEHLNRKTFSPKESSHRLLVQAIAMTASDLSASAKPWDIQIQTVKVIFQEFYQQGDEERKSGRQPIPMMDRSKPEQQSASQVEFLTQICIPCYTLLADVLPGSAPLLQQCQKNLARWRELCEAAENQDVLGLSNS